MGLNADALKKKAETIGSRDSLYFKLEEGRNVIRILPRSLEYFSKAGDTDFAFSYMVHYRLLDVDGYRKIVCKQTSGQKCPICDYIASLEDKTKAKSMRVATSYMYNIFDYDSEKIKVFETGPFIYEEIFKYVVDPDWGDLFALKDGRDVVIEVEAISASQKGKKNPYTVKMTPNKTDITNLLPEKFDEIIDSLRERVPAVHDDGFYLTVVEHLKKGTLPAPIKKEDNKKGGSVAKTEEKKPPVGEKPDCYGLEYSPRADKCKVCTTKADCRDATLKL